VNEAFLQDTRKAITEAYPKVEVLAVVGDISSEAFVDDFVSEAFERFGRLDYCVNCAGIMGNNQASADTSTADFDLINNINYRGCWLSSRAQLRVMLKQEPLASHDAQRPTQRGSIVNIASQLAIVGRPCARKSVPQIIVLAARRSDRSVSNIGQSCLFRVQSRSHCHDSS
jgi:NAD(P)-dependent dehydrogenase (short-subunit alcohol dehydrogenase family)